MSDEWPPYRVGKPEYLHALGVIASVFNQLEFRFRSLFSIYVQSSDGSAYDLFARKNNQERQELMAEALPTSSHPQEIKDRVAHFLTGYRVCTDNRNILMHSLTTFVWLDPDQRFVFPVAAEATPLASPPALPARHEWPRYRRAAEKRDELSPSPHSWPLSNTIKAPAAVGRQQLSHRQP